MRGPRHLIVLFAAGASIGAAPSGLIRAQYEAESARCFTKLTDVLDHAGYTHSLRLDWSEDSPSIVDATEALAAREQVQVAVLWDGARMHAVAPFLTHRRARSLVRFAEGLDDDPLFQFCIFTRAVQEDARERAFQRTTLAAIAGLAWILSAWVLIRITRAARTSQTSSDQNPDREPPLETVGPV